MSKKINIAIAEDHGIVREGLVALFKEHPVINVIIDVSNGKELYERLKVIKPDIILLDLEMPIMSGKEIFEKIKLKYSKIKIIIISATYYEAIILEYVKKGAASFLSKNCKFDKLVEALCCVQNHGIYFDDNISKILAQELIQPKELLSRIEFSELEINILKLIQDGLTSKEIAEKLFINTRTIEWHRSQMIKRTGTKNAPDLVAFAIRSSYL